MQPHGALAMALPKTKAFAPASAICRLAATAPQQATEHERQTNTQQA
jgi:hypothetical protein